MCFFLIKLNSNTCLLGVIDMFRKILDTIKDETLKITVLKGQVDIINYKEIVSFDDNKIIVDCEEMIVNIIGNNLVINRLLDDEVLVMGEILRIEFS